MNVSIRHQHPAGVLFTRDQRTRIGGNFDELWPRNQTHCWITCKHGACV